MLLRRPVTVVNIYTGQVYYNIFMKSSRVFLMLLLFLAIVLLTACTIGQPAQPTPLPPTPQPSVTNTIPPPTPLPLETTTPVRPTRVPGSGPSPSDTLNPSDLQSVINAVIYAVQYNDLSVFERLIPLGGADYSNYIKGSEPHTRSEVLADLAKRLPSQPACAGYSYAGGDLQVWVQGWDPQWEMVQLCDGQCTPIDPPYQSSNGAFLLQKTGGAYQLVGLYLNDPKIYTQTYNLKVLACNATIPTPTPVPTITLTPVITLPTPRPVSCPGAPDQRMLVGGQGAVCTQNDQVVMRLGPSRSQPVIIGLRPGTGFTVIDGPSCADNWSWWKIRTGDGLTGWISEGGDTTDPYYICPN